MGIFDSLTESEPMNNLRRKLLGTCVLGVTLPAVRSAAAQAEYPSKPIRFMVAFGTGTASDTVGRAIADELTKLVGVGVVIENREGAGGNLGHAAAAKAPPDGYTLLMGTALDATTIAGISATRRIGMKSLRGS